MEPDPVVPPRLPLDLEERFGPLAWVGTVRTAPAWSGRDRESGTPILLRLFAIPQGSFDPVAGRERLERFRRVPHPHLDRILATGVHEGVLWVAGERCETDLEARVREQGPLRGRGDLGLLLQVWEGLEALHRAKLAHGDVALATIGLAGGERPVLAAPASALVADPGERLLHLELTGTAAGQAPEVLAGDPPSAASDAYSWAYMAWEACTGAPPWSARELWYQVGCDAWPGVPPLGPELDPANRAFAEALAAYLSPVPGERPTDAAPVRKALASARHPLLTDSADLPAPATASTAPRSRVPEASVFQRLAELRPRLEGLPGHPSTGPNWGVRVSLALAGLFAVLALVSWWMVR